MFIYKPRIPVDGLVFVTDYRTKYDAQLDDALPARAPHVLDPYRVAKDTFGRDWVKVPRISLFEYNQKPTINERKRARDKLHAYLTTCRPRMAVCIPNESGTKQKLGPSVAWSCFNAPDSADEMRGTFHEYAPGQFVTPVHSMSRKLKDMMVWQQSRFFMRAYDRAKRDVKLLQCAHKLMWPNGDMHWALTAMLRKPVAVDIESIESSGLITAIGVSDGTFSVSLPYDSFVPAGREMPEPGYKELPCGEVCLDALRKVLVSPYPKYFHNYTFDVSRLAKEGLPVHGKVHDTFAAHANAFRELRHGLQHAAADMLPIRPWKSAWHPKLRGITRDDEEYWTCDPDALRDYNCDDAFHTWHLARAVLPCVGVTL